MIDIVIQTFTLKMSRMDSQSSNLRRPGHYFSKSVYTIFPPCTFFSPYFSFFTFWKSVLPTTIRLLSALIVSTFDSHKDGWYLRSPASKTEAEVSQSWAAGLQLPGSDDVNWTRSVRSGDRGSLVRHSEIMGSGCKYLALYVWTSQAGEVWSQVIYYLCRANSLELLSSES